MTLRTLTRMRNSLWVLHQGGKAVEGNERSRLRVRAFLTTRRNNLRKSTSREEKKKLVNLQRRLLARFS